MMSLAYRWDGILSRSRCALPPAVRGLKKLLTDWNARPFEPPILLLFLFKLFWSWIFEKRVNI